MIKNNISPGLLIASFYLILQLASIVYAQYSGNRYFCWAPHDIRVEYKFSVFNSLEMPSSKELYARYGLKEEGSMDLPPSHLIQWIKQGESIPGYPPSKVIRFQYRVNGKEWQEWNWPLDQIKD